MAATAVLRSQDCLRRSHLRNTHHNPTQKPNIRPRPRKQSPAGVESNVRDEIKNRSPDRAGPNIPCLPIMGQVKILKRGEPLPAVNKIEEEPQRKEMEVEKKAEYGVCCDAELILGSTGRLGPEPDMVQRQIRVSDFYGVPAPFVESPDPSSLPIPAGLTKKEKKIELTKKEKKIDAATSNLLRLLRAANILPGELSTNEHYIVFGNAPGEYSKQMPKQ